MLDAKQFADDLSSMIEDIPGTLSVAGGHPFPCGFSAPTRSEDLTINGDIPQLEMRAIFPLSALGSSPFPKDGDSVLAKPPGKPEVKCRVGDAIHPEDGTTLVLVLQLDRRKGVPR